MTRGWLAALVAASAVLSGIALTSRQAAPVERPSLTLLTSLPLIFGEQFGLEAPDSDAMARIRQDFDVVPIALADEASLDGQRLLLMAHPRAQPAEVLVELDRWVREGGHVVLLADPRLEWDSLRPLGDRLRPPVDFADTGLLAHWGLRLGTDEAGEGMLRATDAQCRASIDGLSATCQIGRGRADVIADADFMMGVGADRARRLDLMMAKLSRHAAH